MNYNYNKIMKIVFSRVLLIFFAIYLLTGFISCSREEPEIVFGYIDLVLYSGRDNTYEERYSFFIIANDDDGVDNLSELYLYHDREGLRWLISAEDWVRHEEDGITWIGSRSIAMHEGSPMPRGQYRAVLVNRGGESTERRFTYDGPAEPPHPFPSLSISDGIYRIDSDYPLSHFVGYDMQGRAIQTLTITEKEASITTLRLSSNVRSVALWAEDPEYQLSAFTEAVPLR